MRIFWAILVFLVLSVPALADSIMQLNGSGNQITSWDVGSNWSNLSCYGPSLMGGNFAFTLDAFGGPSNQQAGWVFLQTANLEVFGTFSSYTFSNGLLTAVFSGFALPGTDGRFLLASPSTWGYTLVSGMFTEQITLTGTDVVGGDFGTTGMGNITLSSLPPAIPEPETWVTLGTGVLGVIGAARRRFIRI